MPSRCSMSVANRRSRRRESRPSPRAVTVLPVTAASATIADLLIPHHETWVAVLPGSVVGLLALDTEEFGRIAARELLSLLGSLPDRP